jgi:hypothetical protein
MRRSCAGGLRGGCVGRLDDGVLDEIGAVNGLGLVDVDVADGFTRDLRECSEALGVVMRRGGISGRSGSSRAPSENGHLSTLVRREDWQGVSG